MFFHPASMQIGTKKVVNNIKNREIPSKPKIKFIPKKDSHCL